MHYSSFQDVLREKSLETKKGLYFINAKGQKFLTYRELYSNAVLLLGLLQIKVQPGSEIVFQLDDNESFITAFLACLLGKYIAVPLATGSENDCQRKVIKVWETLCRPSLLTDKKNYDRLISYCEVNNRIDFLRTVNNSLLTEEEFMASYYVGVENHAIEEDIAFVQYSSGSTGTPKGCVITHHSLLINTLDIRNRGEIDDRDKSISWLPLSHDFGLICVFLTNILAGIDQYIMPTSLFIRRPTLWLQLVSDHRISLLYSPNFGLQYIVSSLVNKTFSWDLSSVRLIYNGAEPVIDDICTKFLDCLEPYRLNRKAMYPVYGLAEATVGVSFPYQTDEYETATLDRRSLDIGCCIQYTSKDASDAITFVVVGRALDRCKIRIAGDISELPEEHIGHIQIQGQNLIKSYYQNSEETDLLYTDDGWLKTGDLGFLRNGRLFITGRHKNLIIINGQNYYPHDIEMLAFEISALTYGDLIACSIRRYQAQSDELLIFIVHKCQRIPSELAYEVRQKIFQNFGLAPAHIIAIKKTPKTTSGKIQYFKLRELFLNGHYDDQLGEQV